MSRPQTSELLLDTMVIRAATPEWTYDRAALCFFPRRSSHPRRRCLVGRDESAPTAEAGCRGLGAMQEAITPKTPFRAAAVVLALSAAHLSCAESWPRALPR